MINDFYHFISDSILYSELVQLKVEAKKFWPKVKLIKNERKKNQNYWIIILIQLQVKLNHGKYHSKLSLFMKLIQAVFSIGKVWKFRENIRLKSKIVSTQFDSSSEIFDLSCFFCRKPTGKLFYQMFQGFIHS